MEIRSLWFEDAIKDKRLKKAITRLRLKNGYFQHQEWQMRPTNQWDRPRTRSVRMFFVEGDRGGIHAVLLAHKERSWIRIGVFVDRKMRRQKVGTNLVVAARHHYPKTPLRGVAWSDPSTNFWQRVSPITTTKAMGR
jgi:GNAT superfamily N-acetyltransferase